MHSQKCRTISLLSINGKKLNNILLNKIGEKTEVYTSDREYKLQRTETRLMQNFL